MDGKELKKRWQSGTPSFGAWVTSTDPAMAACVCNAGYEWVIIDAEHNPYNPETLRQVLNAIRLRGTVPIVRVTDNNPALIKQALDWGAEGITIPLIKNAQEARQAVQSCHYAPQGWRGFNPRDASNYMKDLQQYAAGIGERVISMLMIENREALDDLDDILRTPQLDSVLIGPADLSYSLGYPLQPGHPQVAKAIDTVIEKCNAAHIPVGIAIEGTPDSYVEWLEKGIDFLPLGMDYKWVYSGGESILQEMHSRLGENR